MLELLDLKLPTPVNSEFLINVVKTAGFDTRDNRHISSKQPETVNSELNVTDAFFMSHDVNADPELQTNV